MKKIDETDKKLFGDYAIAVSGFNKDERKKLLDVIVKQFKDLKVIFVGDSEKNEKLSNIFKLEHKYGLKGESIMKKSIIMSGFLEKGLINFMKSIKSYGLNPEFWAVLTHISNDWKFLDLINELEREAKELNKFKKTKDK